MKHSIRELSKHFILSNTRCLIYSDDLKSVIGGSAAGRILDLYYMGFKIHRYVARFIADMMFRGIVFLRFIPVRQRLTYLLGADGTIKSADADKITFSSDKEVRLKFHAIFISR